jgi:hypothetical protein
MAFYDRSKPTCRDSTRLLVKIETETGEMGVTNARHILAGLMLLMLRDGTLVEAQAINGSSVLLEAYKGGLQSQEACDQQQVEANLLR